jgi:hypothetical protein
MSDPRLNAPPEPFMYEPDLEETEPPVGADHDFPLESEVEEDDPVAA